MLSLRFNYRHEMTLWLILSVETKIILALVVLLVLIETQLVVFEQEGLDLLVSRISESEFSEIATIHFELLVRLLFLTFET